jgi:hypothetical protein
MREDRLAGFWLPALAEGPVIARDAAAAAPLLCARRVLRPTCVIPECNTAAAALLETQGCSAGSRVYRMVRGVPADWSPGLIFARTAGNLG